MKFQVVTTRPFAGISKTSNRPFNMLIVGGIFTGDDGVVALGELTFMERQDQKLPQLTVGQSYEPQVTAKVDSRDHKLKFEVTSMRPITVAALKTA